MENGVLERISAHVGNLSKPKPLSALFTDLRKSGVDVRKSGLEEALKELTAQGRVFRHPPTRNVRNASHQYFGKSPLQYVQNILLQAAQSQSTWTEANLRKRIHKIYWDQFDEALGNLLNAGCLFELRQGRTTHLRTEHPRPTDYMTVQQRRSLQALLNHVNKHRSQNLDFEALLALLDGETPSQPQKLDQDLSEELLVQWYGEDLSKRGGLRSMPISWTWKRYGVWCDGRGVQPNANRFHALLESMASRSRVALTTHDSPYNLPKEEIDILQKNQKGHPIYYWTILG